MTNSCRKFLIVLQKHLQIRLYHIVLTLLEILIPILITLGLLGLKAYIEKDQMEKKPLIIPAFFSPEEDPMTYKSQTPIITVVLVPDNKYTRNLANYWREKNEGNKTDGIKTEGDKIEGEKNEGNKTEGEKTEGEKNEGEKTEGEKSEGNKTEVNISTLDKKSYERGKYKIIPDLIVEFQNEFPSNDNDLPQDLQYCVHANAKSHSWTKIVVPVQHVIALHFMKEVKGHNVSTEITFTLQMFPLPAYDSAYDTKRSLFALYSQYAIPLFFIFLVPVLVTQIVMEKQSGIKELMRMMGLPVSIQWLGFFVNAFIVTLISIIVISILLTKVGFTMPIKKRPVADKPKSDSKNETLNLLYHVDTDNETLFLPSLMRSTNEKNIISYLHDTDNRTQTGRKDDEYYTSPPMLRKTSWIHVFIVLILYVLSSISFCLFLSCLFSTAAKATLFGLLLWCLTIAIPTWLTTAGTVGALSVIEMLLWALLPNMALIWSLRFMNFQEMQDGLKWSHYFESPTLAEEMCLFPLLVMFVLDIILYFFLGWYFDKLFPGKYGIPRPWHFLCTDATPCCRPAKEHDEESLSSSTEEPNRCHQIFLSCVDTVQRKLHVRITPVPAPPQLFPVSTDNFEREPSDLQETLVARSLTKTFRPGIFTSPFYAVHNVNLTVYEGEIFVLLGQNGAGKTVTLSMLTGIYAPTRGSVTINGYDLRTHLTKAREEAGFCPQDNMIFSELTVRQHLNFFGKLKGLKGKSLTRNVDVLLYSLNLWEMRKMRCKKLSGGMLRRLQFAISIVGNVKFLVLDEPSSGLDPESRRVIWDMVLALRERCCILLTTHHMEEADALADRIAIMARGNIICCGSPMSLRKMFGSDYVMKITKAAGCDAQEVLRFVKKVVPAATLEKETYTEISMKLPAAFKGSFSDLFRDLERQMEKLNISSFGVGTLSLDEVFMKVNEIVESKDKSSEGEEAAIAKGRLETSTGLQLCCHRLHGLMMKRVYYIYHRGVLFTITLVLVVVALILAIYLLTKTKKDEAGLKDEWFESPFGTPRMVVFEFHNTGAHCLPEAYVRNIPGNVTVVKVTDNIQTTFLKYTQRDLLGYMHGHFPLGASFESSQDGNVTAKAWYSLGILDLNDSREESEHFYRKMVSLNLVHNAVLQNCHEKRQIVIKLHTDTTLSPMTTREEAAAEQGQNSSLVSFYAAAVLLALGLCLITCNFVLLLVEEKTKQFKHLQIMTGIGSIYFYIAAFLFDFLFYFVHICFIIIVFEIFAGNGPFKSPNIPDFTFLVMLLFGWTAIPLAYLFSLMCKSPSVVYVSTLTVHLLSVVLSIIRLIKKDDPISRTILDFFPVCSAISLFFELWMAEQYATTIGIHVTASEMFEIVGSGLLVMFLSGLLNMLLVLLLDYRLSACLYWMCGREKTSAGEEEPDVEAETKRIKLQLLRQSGGSDKQQSTVKDDAVIVYNLSKKFRKKLVVDHLTFGVHENECFGLLGVNGAGKTTTFRMLTGSLLMSSGNVYLIGTSLRKKTSQYLSMVGYCPQFHTHIDQLTCRETLFIFARLRGIKGELKPIVNAYIKQFGLSENASKKTSTCSLGTNRKLSTALAFLGAPNLVMLDEPTTGVDPASRRSIWDVISASKTKGTCVILTSHSMDECEVLCSRLAIMKKGKFKCIGSGQYLKSTFGKGFNVYVKLAKETDPEKRERNHDVVVNFMDRNFKDCTIVDEHEGLLEYSVPYSSTDWKKLFAAMEEAKLKFNLDDYNVGQATLEQIFLAFASED